MLPTRTKTGQQFPCDKCISTKTYKCCMLVCLQHNMKHFPSILTHLIYQSLTNNQQPWEGCFHNLVKIGPVLSRFEAEHATDGQETLQPCEDRCGLIRVQQLNCDADEGWPLFGEIVVKDLLKDRDELCSDLWWGVRQDWQKTFSKPCLLIFGYGLVLRSLLTRSPSSCYAVLKVDNRCNPALASGQRGRKCAGFVLERRTEGSCSAWRISRSASVKPGRSSACVVEF